MPLKTYIAELNSLYQTGRATEHTYRPALANLLGAMLPELQPTNEPTREKCGAPDYVLLRRRDKIPVGYIEAKDINDPDLEGTNTRGNKEQFDRYKKALDNIIFTDYLHFNFCKKGQIVERIRIAEIRNGKVALAKGNEDRFFNLIKQFGESIPQTISSSSELAKIMAGKARLMADVFERAVTHKNGDKESDNKLQSQMEVFRKVLIEDITEKTFADLYAQTITYGMFAARLHDNSPDDFSRIKAGGLIPATNPLLRKLFQEIATFDLDKRIAWIVDDLTDVFRVTNIEAVLKSGMGEHFDPIFHFYENFLTEYDPELRKSRGVFYTPPAVVGFIVRAVDEILKKDFKLADGLANRDKIKSKTPQSKPKKNGQAFHKVQVLDPALGTGTFLAETVRHIHKRFANKQGMWNDYVKDHLIPRLNGFEILMAPYAMAHLELEWLLTQTGYKATDDKRLNIFLTNSLTFTNTYDSMVGFLQWLADEAIQAEKIKDTTPVMVVMGNPPYAVSSSNSGEWITNLIAEYKQGLNERNIQPLSDDYIKFIRLGQHFINKSGEGVLAYISNNSFLDGLIHRQMRKRLLETFDKIYILDLHGNSNRKEKAPDGTKDDNVFNIQQGVSINLFVKTAQQAKVVKTPACVFHSDLWGQRKTKYDFLNKNTLDSVKWQELRPTKDNYFFVPKNFSLQGEYKKGFKIDELFPVNSSGVETGRDTLFIDLELNLLKSRIQRVLNAINDRDKETYKINNTSGFPLLQRLNISNYAENNIRQMSYYPFDIQFVYYDERLLRRSMYNVMKHLLHDNNIGLLVSRQAITDNWSHIQIVKGIVDNRIHYSNKGRPVSCPLYLYPNQSQQPKLKFSDADKQPDALRTPNLNADIVRKISECIGLEFEAEKSNKKSRFAPIDILDYIYAVLHSPEYRETYKEFLKIDFPRVPYPADANEFHRLTKIGAELRQLHLMEHPALDTPQTTYPEPGNPLVDSVRWELSDDGVAGNIWINTEQYFGNVPLVAWEFYIGGYQPAQKWLKDRKNRKLTHDEIEHYMQIITALAKTHEIQGEIDNESGNSGSA